MRSSPRYHYVVSCCFEDWLLNNTPHRDYPMDQCGFHCHNTRQYCDILWILSPRSPLQYGHNCLTQKQRYDRTSHIIHFIFMTTHRMCLDPRSTCISLGCHFVIIIIIIHVWPYRNLTFGRRIKSASSHKENVWSRHQRLFKENVRKNQKDEGLQNLKIRVRELFTHGEGISTPRVCHKGRQSLIKCAKNVTSILFTFPFLYFFIFWGSTKVLPLLLCILKCNEEFRPT